MIQHYSLIAQKWSEFFQDTQGISHLLEEPLGLRRVLDTWITEIQKKQETPPSRQEPFAALLTEAFLGGLVLFALENNTNILDGSFVVTDVAGLSFFTQMDDADGFLQKIESIDRVSEALLSKLSVQMLNKSLFLFPEDENLLYKKIAQHRNQFYFSGISGYLLGRFIRLGF